METLGASRDAMIGNIAGSVTNIILDPIMILWLNMGVQGAAIATVIGNMVAYSNNAVAGMGVAMKINTVAVYVLL